MSRDLVSALSDIQALTGSVGSPQIDAVEGGIMYCYPNSVYFTWVPSGGRHIELVASEEGDSGLIAVIAQCLEDRGWEVKFSVV